MRSAILAYFFSMAVFASYCDENYLSYAIAQDEISVVYVMREEISDAEARQKAIVEGSRLLCPKGYRYYATISEGKVTVFQMSSRSRDDNAYSGQSARALIEENRAPSHPLLEENSAAYPGYKVVLQGHDEPPLKVDFSRCPSEE